MAITQESEDLADAEMKKSRHQHRPDCCRREQRNRGYREPCVGSCYQQGVKSELNTLIKSNRSVKSFQCSKSKILGVTRPHIHKSCNGRPSKSKRTAVKLSGRLRKISQSLASVLALHSYIFLLPCVILFGFSFGNVSSFNLDLPTAIVQTGDAQSMFGYAVAQYKSSEGDTWLLVGAPKAQTAQYRIRRGGAVYRCGVSRGIGCGQLKFDAEGNEQKHNGSYLVDIEDKTNQWFGATVVTDKELIVACAPRFVYHTQSLDRNQLVGNCLASRDLGQTIVAEYSPCKRAVERSNSLYIDQHDQQGKCEFGFSASISLDGKRILLTAPGSWFWQGQVYNYRTDNGGVRNSASTPEGTAEEDYGFMGYATAVGKFDNDNIDDYVVGVPRGEALLGKTSEPDNTLLTTAHTTECVVVLYTQALDIIKVFPGEQLGAFFGAAVAASDFNDDGLDDVVVGAPQFSDFYSSKSYDEGQVYIYYQVEAKFEKFREQVLEAPIKRSRFGTALAALGDINNDGFNDLAVSAPYGGKEKKGVIYIYHGSKNGIKSKIAQIVHAEDVDTSLLSFGYSMSAGIDMDGNYYPDLLVGAYQSNRAVLLRSRPIVNVVVTQKMVPLLIDVNRKSCILPSTGERRTCIAFETCLKFEGLGVSNTLSFRLKWDIDSKKTHSKRVFIEENGKQNSTKREKLKDLQKRQNWCKSFTAFLRNDFRDLLTPIAVEFKYELIQRHDPRRESLIPILDAYSPNPMKTQSQILKNCGKDNICIPDLSLFAETASDTHILGSDKKIEFTVTVENRGEDAFESLLFLTLPHRVYFDGMNIINAPNSVVVSCSKETIGNGGLDRDLVVCDLGNPLPSHQTVDMKMHLSPQYVRDTAEPLNFTIQVNSTNRENDTHLTDNIVSHVIPLTAVARIEMTGSPKPEQVTYNTSDLTSKTRLSHIYQVWNLGPSRLKKVEVQILWPSFEENGLEILPLQQPIISQAEGDCIIITLAPRNNTRFRYLLPRVYHRYDTRHRQQTEDNGKSETLKLRCLEGWCNVITCTLTGLPDDTSSSVEINITSVLSSAALAAIGHKGALMVHSDAMVKVVELDYDIQLDRSKFAYDRYNVTTDVNAIDFVGPPERVPLWIIGLAIAIGLLLLILLILLLWKLGFFKRKRPDSGVPENQPLNENGK